VAECSWEPVDSHFLWPARPLRVVVGSGAATGGFGKQHPLGKYLASLQDSHIRECIRKNIKPSRPEKHSA